MLKVPIVKLVVFASVISLITAIFALSACTSTTTQTITTTQNETQTNTQTITSTITQTMTTTQQNVGEPTPVSDQQILYRVHKIIRSLGLDVNPGLDFTAQVENGVVILDGTVLYFEEENLLLSVSSIPGVVRIISNFYTFQE